MSVKGFTFYETFKDVADELPVEFQGEFYRAIAEYMFADNDIEGEIPKESRIAFKCVKPNLKRLKARGQSGSHRRKNRLLDDESIEENRNRIETESNEIEKNRNRIETESSSSSSSIGSSSSSSIGRGREGESPRLFDAGPSESAEDQARKAFSADVEEVVSYLNAKTGSAYRTGTDATRRRLRARFDEGFTVADCKRVIDNMTACWFHDAKMRGYLRPETLFGAKFEGYLNRDGPPASALGSEFDDWDRSAKGVQAWTT